VDSGSAEAHGSKQTFPAKGSLLCFKSLSPKLSAVLFVMSMEQPCSNIAHGVENDRLPLSNAGPPVVRRMGIHFSHLADLIDRIASSHD
jgi:hypothetical protein